MKDKFIILKKAVAELWMKDLLEDIKTNDKEITIFFDGNKSLTFKRENENNWGFENYKEAKIFVLMEKRYN